MYSIRERIDGPRSKFVSYGKNVLGRNIETLSEAKRLLTNVNLWKAVVVQNETMLPMT